MKAAVLKGDPDCPELVAFSVYDTKPVHFLSTACTSLNWVEKTRKVFDKATNANVSMSFLRAVVNDEYNNTMNQVDISDQLRNYYRIDHWMRKRKWWWAIWMWGLQVLLINAYILYRTTHLLTWKKAEKTLLSHYEFRRQLVLEWLGLSSEIDNDTLLTEETKSRKREQDSTSIPSASVATSASSKRAKRVTDQTLDQFTGELRMRLDNDFHFPMVPERKYPVCSLCRWVEEDRKKRTRGAIVACDKCLVNLCVSCFKPFHQVADVKHLQSQVFKNKEQMKCE